METPMEASNFFARLLQQPHAARPVLQPDDIVEFEKAWRVVQDTLEQPDERQLLRGIQSTEVPRCLTHIVTALKHEGTIYDEYTLGECMEYFVNNDLLATLEKLSRHDRPHGIKLLLLQTSNDLVTNLPDHLLIHRSVHRPLGRLLQSCIGEGSDDSVRVHGAARALGAAGTERAQARADHEELEGGLVDLMCTLCTRMKAFPALLLVFFHDHLGSYINPNAEVVDSRSSNMSPTPTTQSRSSAAHSTSRIQPRFEFLIFTYLLRFTHREGRIGHNARAGLDHIFNIAFTPQDIPGEADEDPSDNSAQLNSLPDARISLATFILDGDFADVAAAALGALWSLLPNKLILPTLRGTKLGVMLDPAKEELWNNGERLSTDPEVDARLMAVSEFFEFLEDIITQCQSRMSYTPSIDSAEDQTRFAIHAINDQVSRIGESIAKATLDSIQSSFLESVLYPSILECSSTDRSAVAIMVYLDHLAMLEDGVLPRQLFGYLLDAGSSESRFTLKDLIVDNLRSEEPSSTTIAAQLLRRLEERHCTYVTDGLVTTVTVPSPVLPAKRLPTVNLGLNQRQGREWYTMLWDKIDPTHTPIDLSDDYRFHLADAISFIQEDDCFPDLDETSAEPHQLQDRVRPDDALLQALFFSLGQFMYRAPCENIQLTGAIAALAFCPYRSIEGWLIPDSEAGRRRTSSSCWDSDSEDDSAYTLKRKREKRERNLSKPNGRSDPAVYQILLGIVDQMSRLRSVIPPFDQILAAHRAAVSSQDYINLVRDIHVRVVDHPVQPLAPAPTTPTGSPAPKRRAGMMGTLASYLTPGRKASPGPAPSTPSGGGSSSVEGPTTPRQLPSQDPAMAKDPSNVNDLHSSTRQEVDATSSPVRHGPFRAKAPVGTYTTRTGETVPTELLETAHVIDSVPPRDRDTRRVQLDRVLDNYLIMEEFLQELVAVISARQALGIDRVSYGQ